MVVAGVGMKLSTKKYRGWVLIFSLWATTIAVVVTARAEAETDVQALALAEESGVDAAEALKLVNWVE